MQLTRHMIAIASLVLASVMPCLVLAESNPGPVALTLTRADSGNYILPARLDGSIASNMLLDTGASYVSLSGATFKRLKSHHDARFSRYIYGAMANGKVEKIALYFLDELQLADNCVLRNLEVAVLPRADRDILGLNALEKLQPFTLAFAPATLSSQGCTS